MSKKKTDWYYWRLFFTAVSFLNFGLGGLILRFLFIPFLFVLPFKPETRTRIGRLWMHRALKLFVWQMRFFGVLTYEVSGLEKIKPGQLLIANHPSLIDAVFLIALIPSANFIVREGLFSNPFTSGALKGAGYIPNCESVALIQACKQSLANGDVLCIFPEGTRTEPGKIPKFQRGAANIALESGAEIIPVTIKCSENTLTKGEKWYHIPFKRPHWVFSVGDILVPEDCQRTPKAARLLTQQFHNYFFKGETQCH